MIQMKPVMEVIRNSNFSEILKNSIDNNIPLTINHQLTARIMDIITNLYCGETYTELNYHFFPVDTSENNYTVIANYAVHRIVNKLLESASILQLCNNELLIEGITPEKVFTKTYATEKSSGGAYSMSENAPINASLEVINTPNVKSQASSNTKREFEGADNEKEINPYYYEKYIQILNKYNIYNILNNCCRYSIYELNTLL